MRSRILAILALLVFCFCQLHDSSSIRRLQNGHRRISDRTKELNRHLQYQVRANCKHHVEIRGQLRNLDVWNMQTKRSNKAYQQVLSNVISVKGDYTTRFGVIKNGIVGTGFLISEKYVITCKHLTDVLNNDTIQVVLYDDVEISASLLAEDDINDIAVLRIDHNDVNDYNIFDVVFSTGVPSVGETLFMVGSPFGFNNSLTTGTFARHIKANELEQPCPWTCDIYLNDIMIGGGSSGSPVFNANFEVVGINTGYFGNFSVSIPAYGIVKFLEDNEILY